MSAEGSKVKEVKAKTGTTTAKAEQVIGAGAKALSKAVGEAEKVLTKVKEAAELAETLTNEVATKQAELDNLTVQFEEKERQAIIDLTLKVQEKKGQLITEFLSGEGKEAIISVELATLKTEKANLESNFKAEVAKETAAIKASEAASYTAKLAAANSENKANNAVQSADLSAALKQVAFYENEVKELRKQLDSERTARVEEAKARGNAVVTVNSGKN